MPIRFGVPQGPMLFSIFCNNVPDFSNHSEVEFVKIIILPAKNKVERIFTSRLYFDL